MNGVNRARRVTMEEKYRQEREREAELEGEPLFTSGRRCVC
jgi:hypothetical protein